MISWSKLCEWFKRSPQQLLKWLHDDPDQIKLWGRLQGTFLKDGQIVGEIDDNNLVIKNGKVYVLKLLAGLAGVQPITKMAVGDGGCGATPFPTSDQLDSPIPFTLTDTGLRHPILFDGGITAQPLTTVPVVDSLNQFVTFSVTFNSSQAVTSSFGFTQNSINEAALISGDGQILALRAMKSHPFDRASAIEFRANWAIGVT